MRKTSMITLTTIGKPKLSPKVQEYRDTFGLLPSAEAMKWRKTSEVEAMATEALQEGEPIEQWKNRPNIKTGTVTDGWYAQKKQPE
jgi:hypothetical protein